MPATFYINFYDEINPVIAQQFMGACHQVITQKQPDELYFLFSSPGGRVDAGIVLYNFINALAVDVTMHNTGSIDSIASVVFLAGSKRLAAKNASFLIYGIQCNFNHPISLTIPQLQENINRAKRDESKISNIYSERTSMSEEEITGFFREGDSKDLDFALEKGIISEISDPAIPKNAPFINFAFGKQPQG